VAVLCGRRADLTAHSLQVNTRQSRMADFARVPLCDELYQTLHLSHITPAIGSFGRGKLVSLVPHFQKFLGRS